ncbi:hypothetical protein [Cerasicoccus arenae]|uniref:Uncharacterized protein n=1 Tax=Cerasicoccus arenae TaxID=424488 RepID=A0A8J3DCK7_9BACT|nr:hypothetical protein [Cerasicoccus arenae]MBK1857571.1 hypothetical protein [Cerasicoccus arenae]GHC05843.1 hypothetical protein GCM10007047_23550 [Cerasicoccus arenae]
MISETISIYLGYSIATYSEVYDFKHLLVLAVSRVAMAETSWSHYANCSTLYVSLEGWLMN